jgi:hypothetical protein
MPDDDAQPAVALPKPDRPRVKELSIREIALQYLGELPDGEKPVNRLLHYGAGALATDELLACVFSANCKGHADAQHLLSAFEGLPGLAQATAYVIFDPSHLDNPPDLAYYAATEEEAETFFAGCEIVDSVEPEDIVEAP